MMTITADSLQIHRGTSAVVHAKAERIARELGGATIVTVDPEVVASLTPIAWHSVSLFDDRLRRILSSVLTLVGLACATIAFFVWLAATLGIMAQHQQLDAARARSEHKTALLMDMVEKSRSSIVRQQVANLADLNENLVSIGAWLKFYQIQKGVVRWRAQAPLSVTGDKIKELGAKLLESEERGVRIGTDNDPVEKR